MSIPFTQFLRPNGRTKPVNIERPKQIEDLALALVQKGCLFEIEELTTGEVSMEVMKGEDSIAHELCPNGPEVPGTVDRLIINAYHAV